MAEYLLPNNEKLSVKEQRQIFAARNRMVNISENFPLKKKKEECPCGQVENMKHLYNCKHLNIEEESIPYEIIFFDNVKEQKTIMKRFEKTF